MGPTVWMTYLARKVVPPGQSGFSGGAAVEGPAFGQEAGAGCPVYGPVNTTTTQQGCVGCIDNGIHRQGGDVSLEYRYSIKGLDGIAVFLSSRNEQ